MTPHRHRSGERHPWRQALLALFFLLTMAPVVAQVNYTFNFDVNSTGWTGNFSYFTGTTACGGAGGAMRRNLYASATTGQLISPSTGTAAGGEITITYSYKVANWSGNTVATPTPWGSFVVQYGASATGPWTTFATVSNETQLGNSCISKSHTFTPPVGALFIRWGATFSGSGDYYLNFDNVVLSEAAAVACSGAPDAGTASASSSAVCSGVNFTLSATGLTSGTGISYQWERSTDGGGSWNNIPGATSNNATVSQTVATLYRIATTCANSGQSSVSNEVAVSMESSPAFPQDFSSGVVTPGCWTVQAVSGTAVPLYSAASGFGSGTGSALFGFYNISSGQPALISSTFGPTSEGQELSFDVAGATYTGGEIDQVFLEASGDGGTFWTTVQFMTNGVAGGVLNTGGATSSNFVPTPAQWSSLSYTLPAGTNRVRFRGISAFGNNVYFDNLVLSAPPVPCTGVPAPGATLAGAASVCPGAPLTLSLENATAGTGVTYQWFVSTVSSTGPWSPVGANDDTYATTQTQQSWYYCEVTCSEGPSTTASTVVEVGINPPSACYCEPTYTFGKTDGDLISNVAIAGTTLSNNTGTDPVNPAYTYFNTLPNHTGTLQAGTSYTIQVTYGSFASQNCAVWIDFNGDGVFSTPAERVGFTTAASTTSFQTVSFTISLPCDPTPGTYRMRVRDVWNTAGSTIDPCANYGYGETEDYDVTVDPPPPCPSPSALVASNVSVTTADLAWTLGCSETAWEVEYGPAGFTLGTGSSLPVASASASLTGLTGGIAYEAYVRADCESNGVSSWTGPVSFTTLFPPPANDDCANAIALSCNSSVNGTTLGANGNDNPGQFCGTSSNTSAGVWYTVQGWNGLMSASLCGSTLEDTKMQVYTGSCGAFTCVAGNDDACGAQSRVNWTGVSGVTYYIYVYAFTVGDTYSFTLTTTCGSNNPTCPENGLTLEIEADANFSETSWEIIAQGSNVVAATGGGLPAPAIITQFACLPDGCYRLRVLDAGGDGITNGGYILRTQGANERVIDNRDNFTTGSVSAVNGNGGFCLPLGTDKLIYTSCDKLDWVNNQFIVVAENPAVSAQWQVGDQTDDGYQFWWFDPNGSYGYSKFRNHATSDGFGPANAVRACHARINNWSPNQIPANVLMNVKVRSRVNGVNSAWGPVCRFKIDPARAACPLTKLMDIPGNVNYSCGVTRAWGSGAANKVVARPVEGATQYQFRFTNGELGTPVIRTTTTPLLQLNWSPALDNGTYEVQVRAYKNGQWCVTSLPWGDVCNVTITGSPNAMVLDGGSTTSTGDAKLALFPNPNNGQQLTVSLSAVEAGVETIAVDIFDLNGARVSAQVIAVNDGLVYQVMDVAGLADGLYMVNITAGGQRYTERLVIAK